MTVKKIIPAILITLLVTLIIFLNLQTLREWNFNKWNFWGSLIFSIWVLIKKAAYYKSGGQKNLTAYAKSAAISIMTFVLIFTIIGVTRMTIATLSMSGTGYQ